MKTSFAGASLGGGSPVGGIVPLARGGWRRSVNCGSSNLNACDVPAFSQKIRENDQGRIRLERWKRCAVEDKRAMGWLKCGSSTDGTDCLAVIIMSRTGAERLRSPLRLCDRRAQYRRSLFEWGEEFVGTGLQGRATAEKHRQHHNYRRQQIIRRIRSFLPFRKPSGPVNRNAAE